MHLRVRIGGSEHSKVGVSGDDGGGTISASVAHDVPGLDFEVNKPSFFLMVKTM